MSNMHTFGELVKELRIKQELTLRDVCQKLDYDYSNWSKIERGVISPPSDEIVLRKWAKVLGLRSDKAIKEFVDLAYVSQGIIPDSIMANKNVQEILPAFFRTLRNSKPTKKEIDKLIELIRQS